MKRLTVVQHHSAEGPGRIAGWAARRDVVLEHHHSRADAPFPAHVADGLILLGGPASVVEPTATIRTEIDALTALLAHRPDVPVLGICLGAQLLARALGAQVRRMAHAETGWTTMQLADSGGLEALQWHDDAFDAPLHGDVLIAGREPCPVQGFRTGRRVGLQFHPEWDPPTLAAMRASYGELPFFVDDNDARHDRVAQWLDALLDDLFRPHVAAR